jgi:multiple sugar transport system permease protein
LWLADPKTSLPAIIALDFWGGLGYNAVLFFAALVNVSQELYEAARLDGAHPWTVMWKIAFPITLDFFGVVTILQFLNILLWTAQNVYLLTKGGPGDSSMTLSYYLFFNGVSPSQHLGYSQAIGVILFVFGLIGMLIIRKISRRNA